jgi:hypothetical protein
MLVFFLLISYVVDRLGQPVLGLKFQSVIPSSSN